MSPAESDSQVPIRERHHYLSSRPPSVTVLCLTSACQQLLPLSSFPLLKAHATAEHAFLCVPGALTASPGSAACPSPPACSGWHQSSRYLRSAPLPPPAPCELLRQAVRASPLSRRLAGRPRRRGNQCPGSTSLCPPGRRGLLGRETSHCRAPWLCSHLNAQARAFPATPLRLGRRLRRHLGQMSATRVRPGEKLRLTRPHAWTGPIARGGYLLRPSHARIRDRLTRCRRGRR